MNEQYKKHCEIKSDINEHLPTLLQYAKKCNHITECGVRTVTSSYALALGLIDQCDTTNKKIIQVDPFLHENIAKFKDLCKQEGLNCVFYEQSDLECPMEKTDLLFIDTWHVYPQLKRELYRWHGSVSKYIIMHDTTTFGYRGEGEVIKGSSYSKSDIENGLIPAIYEFLMDNTNWVIKEKFENNNGLTVLERIYEDIRPPLIKRTYIL